MTNNNNETSWQDGLPANVLNALKEPLDQTLIKQRSGPRGNTFSYLDGGTIIATANEVFGYDGWGYEVLGPVTLIQVGERGDSKSGEIKPIRCYTATVKVNVTGVPSRTDVGMVFIEQDNPESHETAYKGSVTDGLKRALRGFGDRFGNRLYVDDVPRSGKGTGNGRRQQPKGNSPEDQRQADAGSDSQDQTNGTSETSNLNALRRRLVDVSAAKGVTVDQLRETVLRRDKKDLNDLTEEELRAWIDRAEKARANGRHQAAG